MNIVDAATYAALIGLLIVVAIGLRNIYETLVGEDVPEPGRRKEDGFRVGDKGRTRSGRQFEIMTDLREHQDPRLKYYLWVSIYEVIEARDVPVYPVMNEYVNRDGLVDEHSHHDNDLIWETLDE